MGLVLNQNSLFKIIFVLLVGKIKLLYVTLFRKSLFCTAYWVHFLLPDQLAPLNL